MNTRVCTTGRYFCGWRPWWFSWSPCTVCWSPLWRRILARAATDAGPKPATMRKATSRWVGGLSSVPAWGKLYFHMIYLINVVLICKEKVRMTYTQYKLYTPYKLAILFNFNYFIQKYLTKTSNRKSLTCLLIFWHLKMQWKWFHTHKGCLTWPTVISPSPSPCFSAGRRTWVSRSTSSCCSTSSWKPALWSSCSSPDGIYTSFHPFDCHVKLAYSHSWHKFLSYTNIQQISSIC